MVLNATDTERPVPIYASPGNILDIVYISTYIDQMIEPKSLKPQGDDPEEMLQDRIINVIIIVVCQDSDLDKDIEKLQVVMREFNMNIELFHIVPSDSWGKEKLPIEVYSVRMVSYESEIQVLKKFYPTVAELNRYLSTNKLQKVISTTIYRLIHLSTETADTIVRDMGNMVPNIHT